MGLVRISEVSKTALRRMAKQRGESMQAVLDRAIEQYRRLSVLAETNVAYGRLREHAAEWESLEEERRVWDATLQDGFERQYKIPSKRPGKKSRGK